MKASRAAVKQVRTMEELAEVVQAQSERIDSLEVKIDELLTLVKEQGQEKRGAVKAKAATS